MKNPIHPLSFVLCLYSPWLSAQNLPDRFSLIEYTPKLTAQDGKNCFAYASAYVAMSTRKAFLMQKENPDSAFAYSFGFIDGVIRMKGQKNVRSMAVQKWGGSPTEYNTLDDAFLVLLEFGTVSFSEFPYVTAKDIKKNFRKKYGTTIEGIPVTKAINRVELVTSDDRNQIDTVQNRIIRWLAKGFPVIAAIEQKTADCSQNFIGNRADNTDNHIVNVIGYDRLKQKFFVKNNYDRDCSIEVDIEKFIRSLFWAYVIDLEVNGF